MNDQKAKKIPWGWIILFAIVVLYFFASYMREQKAGQSAEAHSQAFPSLQEALTPEAKKAASQKHTEGLSYGTPNNAKPPIAIEDLPTHPVPSKDKLLKEPVTYGTPKAMIAPINSGDLSPHESVPSVTPSSSATEKPGASEEGGSVSQQEAEKTSAENQSNPSWVSLSSWTVEVGTFSENQHPQQLIEQLREKHLPAYKMQQTLASGEIVTHVYVGPVLQRQQAEQLRQQIQNQMALKGHVVAYTPILQDPSQVG